MTLLTGWQLAAYESMLKSGAMIQYIMISTDFPSPSRLHLHLILHPTTLFHSLELSPCRTSTAVYAFHSYKRMISSFLLPARTSVYVWRLLPPRKFINCLAVLAFPSYSWVANTPRCKSHPACELTPGRYSSPCQVCKVFPSVLDSTQRALSFAMRKRSKRNHLLYNYNGYNLNAIFFSGLVGSNPRLCGTIRSQFGIAYRISSIRNRVIG